MVHQDNYIQQKHLEPEWTNSQRLELAIVVGKCFPNAFRDKTICYKLNFFRRVHHKFIAFKFRKFIIIDSWVSPLRPMHLDHLAHTDVHGPSLDLTLNLRLTSSLTQN